MREKHATKFLNGFDEKIGTINDIIAGDGRKRYFLLSAFLRNFFLCQPPHLAQPCCVALGCALDLGHIVLIMIGYKRP